MHESGSVPYIENTIPVLPVRDLGRSIRFYQSLGFKLDWEAQPTIASVSRDGHAIMLQRRDEPAATWVWIGCSSVALIWQSVRSRKDVGIAQPPTNQPWALEIKLRDPDENILWFGSDPLNGVPFGQSPPES